MNSRAFHPALPLLGLLALGLLAYAPFYEPVLFSDDWPYCFGARLRGTLDWFDPVSARPLQDLVLTLLSWPRFSLDRAYLALGLCNVGAAAAFYALVVRCRPGERLAAWLAAALFLVHPAETTRMWVTTVSLRLVLVLVLLAGVGCQAYLLRRNRLALAGALLAVAVTFLIYEGQLGLVLLWPLLLWAWARGRSEPGGRAGRVGLFAPWLLAAVFLAWKVYQLKCVAVDETRLEQTVLGPAVILRRYLDAAVLQVKCWTEPVIVTLGWGRFWQGGLLLLGLAAGGFTLGGWLGGRRGAGSTAEPHRLAADARMALAGVLLAVAGYVPVIAIVPPSLRAAGTRNNYMALLGVSLAMVYLVRLAAGLAWRSPRARAGALLGALLPWLATGAAIQARVQYDARQAWREQRHFWHSLFRLAPDLQDGTRVYLRLAGPFACASPYGWARAPFTVSWELADGLRVLYRNTTLNAALLKDGVWPGLIRIAPEGIVEPAASRTVPYAETLFLRYDGPRRTLSLIEDLPAVFGGQAGPGYAPRERIRPAAGPRPERAIVGSDPAEGGV